MSLGAWWLQLYPRELLVGLVSERGECMSARERRGGPFVSSVLHPLLLPPLLLRLLLLFSFSFSYPSSFSSSSEAFLLLYLL
jgi:hypothetical protein